MKINVLRREQCIPARLPEVFAFFSEARNLDRITPPWLRFKVLAQTDPELKVGTLIYYKLAWSGVPLKWTTRIEEWCPPALFVDVQLKGPYCLWRHTHEFEACDGGTLMRDMVEYALRMGHLGDFCAGGLVRRDVERIFDYRAKQISAIFPGQHVPSGTGYGKR